MSSAHSSIPITQTEGRKTKRHDQSRQDRVKVRSWTTNFVVMRLKVAHLKPEEEISRNLYSREVTLLLLYLEVWF